MLELIGSRGDFIVVMTRHSSSAVCPSAVARRARQKHPRSAGCFPAALGQRPGRGTCLPCTASGTVSAVCAGQGSRSLVTGHSLDRGGPQPGADRLRWWLVIGDRQKTGNLMRGDLSYLLHSVFVSHSSLQW